MQRYCDQCGTKKDLSEFPTYNNKGKIYHRYDCESCFNPSKHYQDNRETILQRAADDRRKNPEKFMFRAARNRAKRDGIEFSIVVEDIKIPDKCPVFDIPLKVNRIENGRRDSPSLDRIDPSKGYTKDNIQVISNFANIMKQNATADELLAFARWVVANYQSQATAD